MNLMCLKLKLLLVVECLILDLLQLSTQPLLKLQLVRFPQPPILSMNAPPGLTQHGPLLPLPGWISTSTTGESLSRLLEQLGGGHGGGLI